MPRTPSSVSITTVTKLRPGQVTTVRAAAIFIRRSSPSACPSVTSAHRADGPGPHRVLHLLERGHRRVPGRGHGERPVGGTVLHGDVERLSAEEGGHPPQGEATPPP